MGLGLAAWACGRSSKNSLQTPGLAEGGCANDCSGSAGLLTSNAAGMPDAAAGSVSQGGTFSAQAGAPSSAGTASSAGAPSSELPCEGNTCQSQPCLPGSNLCVDRDVYSCLGQGAKALKRTCLFGNGCADVPGTVDCVVLACEPDATACVDNQLGSCAHDGGSLSSVSQDCAEQGKVCDASGDCSSAAIDEVGGNTRTLVATHIFNAIDVQSARRLTKLELGIASPTGDVNVHWQIYRQLYPGSGDFVEMLAEADSVLVAGEASAVTTELRYAFETGKQYYLGATVDAEDGVNAASEIVGEPQQLSFGLLNVPNNVLHVFKMRITTELP